MIQEWALPAITRHYQLLQLITEPNLTQLLDLHTHIFIRIILKVHTYNYKHVHTVSVIQLYIIRNNTCIFLYQTKIIQWDVFFLPCGLFYHCEDSSCQLNHFGPCFPFPHLIVSPPPRHFSLPPLMCSCFLLGTPVTSLSPQFRATEIGYWCNFNRAELSKRLFLRWCPIGLV